MEALSPELHFKIYTSACTDDGTTACSLSRVSRCIREVSAPRRYQSIAVYGPAQIRRLVKTLRVVPPQLRRVRFFFIYDRSTLPTGDLRAFLDAYHRSFHASESPAAAPTLYPWTNAVELGDDLIELLTMAQDTVEVLSVVSVKDGAQGPPLLQGSFPALTELTIRGSHTIPVFPTFAPRLKTLHVTVSALPVDFAATVAKNHPHLSRVRISRCYDIRGGGDIMQLAHVMGIATPSTPNKPMPRTLRRGVERLLLLEPAIQTELHNFNSRVRLLPFDSQRNATMEASDARLALDDWHRCVVGEPMELGTGEPAWDVDPLAEKRAVEPQYYTAVVTSRLRRLSYPRGHTRAPQVVTLKK
ncbi:hypothetical protein C8F04DRAFT_1233185 [Mycena alexandri]|uniref:Uncharacterized protein n=1 Tax=Mycena alexandri TaxID=1745969 RepID=A0AAD6SZ17_9AGAR|nr:hypothetical protein C8F04DRAFT_1233185 [Mycena alexandri]